MPYEKIILSTGQLQRIVSRLADEVSSAYRDVNDCTALILLEGARYFADDLLKQVTVPMQVEAIKASSYSGTNSTGNVTIENAPALAEMVRDRNVLLIDDIYDTGLTLSRLLEHLKTYQPKSVRTCVLLEKQTTHTKSVDIDFLGTTVEDEFLIGYGLDYNGQYRDLPCIGVLSNERIEESPTL